MSKVQGFANLGVEMRESFYITWILQNQKEIQGLSNHAEFQDKVKVTTTERYNKQSTAKKLLQQ